MISNEEKQKLEDFIESGFEGDFLDFKLQPYMWNIIKDKQSFLIDMMSFANSNYDEDKYIIIGVKVKEDGERIIQGITDLKLIKDSSVYTEFIVEYITPTIDLDFFLYEYNNMTFGIYKVKNTNIDKPYIVKKKFVGIDEGTIRIRKGSRNSFITRYDLDNIYKKKIPIKKSNLILSCLDEKNEISKELILKQFNYDLKLGDKKKEIIDLIKEIDKINFNKEPVVLSKEEKEQKKEYLKDKYGIELNVDLSKEIKELGKFTLGRQLTLKEEDIDSIKKFIKENKIKVNKDFFDIGNVGWFSIMIGQGNYTGDKECIKKYEKIKSLRRKVNLYYQFIQYKKELNELRYIDLVLSNIGPKFDEMININIEIPKEIIVEKESFPKPRF